MPLIPILLPRASSSKSLVFVDSTGLNPLPPGIIVTLTASGAFVARAMLQAGGIMPGTINAGTYTASFVGTQAPFGTVTFTAFGPGVIAKVPNYMSPTYSGAGYALEAAHALVSYWHDVTINSSWLAPQ